MRAIQSRAFYGGSPPRGLACSFPYRNRLDTIRQARYSSAMSINVLKLADELRTEGDAYGYLENLRWGDKPVCPHCGSVRKHYFLKPANGKARKTRTGAPSERRVWKCADCRKQF